MPFATGRLRKEQAAAGLRARATGTAKPSMAVSCKATCWGDPGSGGDCSALTFTGKEQVFSTNFAFMSLDPGTGKATCWGESGYGGDCSALTFTGKEHVFSTGYAFMSLDPSTGKATCWGDSGYGGYCPALTFTGKEQVFSTDAAFMSLEVEDLATVIPHALRSYLERAHVDAHVLGRAWTKNR